MIKFFRRIRQNLLSQNKFSKYLLYAIGEITLVVIGILIALQINNWKQGQGQKRILKNIYATIKVDLQQDIENIDKIVNYTEPGEENYLAIINKTRKKGDYVNCERCKFVNIGSPDLILRKNGFKLLLDYNKQHSISNDSLSIKVNRLNIDLGNLISVDLSEIVLNSNSLLEILKHTKPWFTDLVSKNIISDDFIEYALTDIGYRNTATVIHHLYYKKLIPHLKQYKIESADLIKLINRKLENE